MPTLQAYDTVWEDNEGKTTPIIIRYVYYKGYKGRMEDGLQIEPDENPSVEIYNIRTANNQDPRLAIQDWDRDYAIDVLSDRILEEVG